MAGNSFLLNTDDGRRWRVEVFGPGQKCKVTDIDSPTGYSEWVTPDSIGVTFHTKQN